ncbi:hypothetical protein QFZ20_003013 [Flavobacterium sp. W4I14]|nr:hypothetical protein [Flavobacterium sp. W4I14]
MPKDSKTIGLVTVNQDTFTNPTLFSIIEKLNNEGNNVVLFNDLNQNLKPASLKNIQYYNLPKGIRTPRRPDNFFKYIFIYLRIFLFIKKLGIKNLIAVDPNGLIIAGRIKKLIKTVNIHYFSFEIFFNDEVAHDSFFKQLKKKEIIYSQNVASIVIQDKVRKDFLIEQNKISPSFKNWYYIPVSPIVQVIPEKKYTREKFGVKDTDIFYVYSGSIANWAGMAELIQAIKNGFPPNVYLLLHNKISFDRSNLLHDELLRLKEINPNLIMHNEVFDEYENYMAFLNMFNYGIVIYKPDGGVFTGKNIRDIGLSSGKFSCYMAMGLPCLLYQCKTYTQLVNQYNIGRIVTEEQDLSYHFHKNTLAEIPKQNCKKIYDEILDPRGKIELFIQNELLNA